MWLILTSQCVLFQSRTVQMRLALQILFKLFLTLIQCQLTFLIWTRPTLTFVPKAFSGICETCSQSREDISEQRNYLNLNFLIDTGSWVVGIKAKRVRAFHDVDSISFSMSDSTFYISSLILSLLVRIPFSSRVQNQVHCSIY